MSNLHCSLPPISKQAVACSFPTKEHEGTFRRSSLLFPELQICLNSATRDEVIISAKRTLLPNYIGGQR